MTRRDKARKDCATWLHRYIRLKYLDGLHWLECVTCGKRYHWTDTQRMNVGHCWPARQNQGVEFDTRAVAPQCSYCNAPHGGNGRQLEFIAYIRKTYGDNVLAELEITRRHGKNITEIEILQVAYKKMVYHLLEEKGLEPYWKN